MVEPQDIQVLTDLTNRQRVLLQGLVDKIRALNATELDTDEILNVQNELKTELEYAKYLLEEIDRLCQML